jgi:methylglyoxal/glyoxal reductase
VKADATVLLRNGVGVPCLGLGVYRVSPGQETRRAVCYALDTGYRHIDTASDYGNEEDVGAAIRESRFPRAEIFVTTKLWNEDQGFDSALRAFDASCARLGLGYVDLYLLHWPVRGRRLESWRALELLLDQGRVRAIGVSNFMSRHLEELSRRAHVMPLVNQIEVSPFLQQQDVRAFCDKQGIAVEAYSPLTKGVRLGHPVVGEVAKQLRRSPAQILLRWGLQHGLVVLPKSTQRERIAENAGLFDFAIPDESMLRLDSLEEGLVTGWDPRRQM